MFGPGQDRSRVLFTVDYVRGDKFNDIWYAFKGRLHASSSQCPSPGVVVYEMGVCMCTRVRTTLFVYDLGVK